MTPLPAGCWSHSYSVKFEDPAKDVFHCWVYPKQHNFPARYGHGVSHVGYDDAIAKALTELSMKAAK